MFALCVCVGPTYAQSDDYKALTTAAVEEHSLGHYEEARALFGRAHEIAPSARTFWGMGIAAFEARNYVDALRMLTAAREDSRKPLTPAQRKQTDSLLERAQAFVVRLPLRVSPRSARVSINGRPAEAGADGLVLLDVGTHQVVVSAPGYEEVTRTMRLEAGKAEPLEVELEKKRSASDAALATASQPAPERAQAPPADASEGVRVSTVLKWVSLGTTLASLGAMGAGLGLRESAARYYADESKCPLPDRDLSCPGKRAEVGKWKAMAIAGGAAAGVFAALTIVFFVVDRRPNADSARAGTECGPAFTAGVSCVTRF